MHVNTTHDVTPVKPTILIESSYMHNTINIRSINKIPNIMNQSKGNNNDITQNYTITNIIILRIHSI